MEIIITYVNALSMCTFYMHFPFGTLFYGSVSHRGQRSFKRDCPHHVISDVQCEVRTAEDANSRACAMVHVLAKPGEKSHAVGTIRRHMLGRNRRQMLRCREVWLIGPCGTSLGS